MQAIVKVCLVLAALPITLACAPQEVVPPAPPGAVPLEPAEPAPTAAGAQPPGTGRARRGPLARVTRVVDGDTIDVVLAGRTERVRLIGIDTPESVDPRQPVQCFALEASAFAARHLEGRRVELEFDAERRDRYGRLLAYVWLDGRLFNLTLVRRGYAQVYTFPPNVRYVERLLAAQRRARSGSAGLWGACPAGGDGAAGKPPAPAGCDPNYSGACIPPYPPDLDCSQVGARGFASTGSDPHGFDEDGDGIACET